MSADDVYRQCELERVVDESRLRRYVAWIPSKFATVGKCVKVWRDGEERGTWVVCAVYEAMKFSDLQIQRHAEKRWRDVLDRDGELEEV